MENTAKLKFYPRNDLSALEFLESEAALIAKDDFDFRNTYYREYLGAAKRIARALLKFPLKGIFLLPDGSIQKMERGQSKRKAKKRKSFSEL